MSDYRLTTSDYFCRTIDTWTVFVGLLTPQTIFVGLLTPQTIFVGLLTRRTIDTSDYRHVPRSISPISYSFDISATSAMRQRVKHGSPRSEQATYRLVEAWGGEAYLFSQGVPVFTLRTCFHPAHILDRRHRSVFMDTETRWSISDVKQSTVRLS